MKLAIIIGSTRPGRVTERLARWVINEAKELPQTDLDIIDLVDYDMPLFNRDKFSALQFKPSIVRTR